MDAVLEYRHTPESPNGEYLSAKKVLGQTLERGKINTDNFFNQALNLISISKEDPRFFKDVQQLFQYIRTEYLGKEELKTVVNPSIKQFLITFGQPNSEGLFGNKAALQKVLDLLSLLGEVGHPNYKSIVSHYVEEYGFTVFDEGLIEDKAKKEVKSAFKFPQPNALTRFAGASLAATVAATGIHSLVDQQNLNLIAVSAAPNFDSAFRTPVVVLESLPAKKVTPKVIITPTPTPSSTSANEPTALPTLTPTVIEIQPKSTTQNVVTATPEKSSKIDPKKEAKLKTSPEPTKVKELKVPEEKASQKEKAEAKNVVDFFLGDLVNHFVERGIQKRAEDLSYAERVSEKAVQVRTLNTVFLIIDEYDGRPDTRNGRGWGRADTIILTSFDPVTLKSVVTSFPRDLFVPELKDFFSGQRVKNDRKFQDGAKISSTTLMGYLKEYAENEPDFDQQGMMKKIIESATGMRIDMVVWSNINLMQGSEDSLSIFDVLFPEGLEINAEGLIDEAFPTDNYGTRRIVIDPGKQVMHAETLIPYARSRHTSESDSGRSRRQRQVFEAAGVKFAINSLADFLKGNTENLDLLINNLEIQANKNNYYDDREVSSIQILKTIRDKVQDLRKDPAGWIALTQLMVNSAGEVKDLAEHRQDYFKQINLYRESGLVVDNNRSDDYFFPNIHMIKVAGRTTNNQATELGNYISYWQPIRDVFGSLIDSSN